MISVGPRTGSAVVRRAPATNVPARDPTSVTDGSSPTNGDERMAPGHARISQRNLGQRIAPQYRGRRREPPSGLRPIRAPLQRHAACADESGAERQSDLAGGR